MTQEALKLALDALKFAYNHCDSDWVQDKKINPAIAAIKEALAQTQEPIYQYQMANGSWIDETKESHDYNVRHGQATVRVVHTAPPQLEQEPVADDFFRMIADKNPKPFPLPQRTWVGLTDVEIDYLLGSTAGENEETHISFARAIEAKLKDKNCVG